MKKGKIIISMILLAVIVITTLNISFTSLNVEATATIENRTVSEEVDDYQGLIINANNAPIDQSSKRLFNTFFLVNTANGKTIAFKEHKCSGKYSNGEFQTTKLYIIAAIPENDKMPNTIVLTLSLIFFKINQLINQ